MADMLLGCMLQQQKLKARSSKDRTKSTAVEWNDSQSFLRFR